MKDYIEKLNINAILQDLTEFENSLKILFEDYDMNLRDNLGRRNALISTLQEKVTAKHLRTIFESVDCDGAPGKPDITINDINRELECKITSGSRSKGYVSYALQTDYDTICKKESLDYMYILCNKTFNKFCVLFFKDLTSNDFFPPASGSRGKSRMKKKNAMKKCIPLHGGFTIKNETLISRYEQRKIDLLLNHNEHIGKLLNKAYDEDVTIDHIGSLIEKEEVKHEKKVEELNTKIKNWSEKDPQFTFVFEEI